MNILVTNGLINREPLEVLLPYIDAMNIDLKAFSNKFYKDICKGSLEPVKNTIEIAAAKCHVEVTTLIIPGLNDSREEIQQLSKWLSSISSNITLHLLRFFPNYKLQDISPTSKESLFMLGETAKKIWNMFI